MRGEEKKGPQRMRSTISWKKGPDMRPEVAGNGIYMLKKQGIIRYDNGLNEGGHVP